MDHVVLISDRQMHAKGSAEAHQGEQSSGPSAVEPREKRQTAELTVDSIHEQLDALDPVTRAAVIARLSSDEVEKVRNR